MTYIICVYIVNIGNYVAAVEFQLSSNVLHLPNTIGSFWKFFQSSFVAFY